MKPIKRHESLQPLSRDHHHGLLLGWKIRKGLQSGVETKRIVDYAGWFYKHHLLPHFETEEQLVFPILGSGHEMIRRAVDEHRQLEALFTQRNPTSQSLERAADLLDRHIRFEERELFQAIQQAATEEQLKQVESAHREEPFCDNTEDAFWL